MKILIAEDEETTLATMEFKLKKEGYEVLKASNGREALELLDKHDLDLVITDIHMPLVSGLEVLSFAKKQKPPIQVIVLSAAGQESDVMVAFNMGADDYMTKPFSPNELVSRVRRFNQGR